METRVRGLLTYSVATVGLSALALLLLPATLGQAQEKANAGRSKPKVVFNDETIALQGLKEVAVSVALNPLATQVINAQKLDEVVRQKLTDIGLRVLTPAEFNDALAKESYPPMLRIGVEIAYDAGTTKPAIFSTRFELTQLVSPVGNPEIAYPANVFSKVHFGDGPPDKVAAMALGGVDEYFEFFRTDWYKRNKR